MADQDAIINRYINDVATLRHNLIVAEIDRDEALADSAQKDGVITALREELTRVAPIPGEIVEEVPAKTVVK